MLQVRCKSCGKELTSTTKIQSCGCPNMMKVVDDKIGAVDLTQVVMINSNKSNNKSNVLTQEDIMWQEERKRRKVRKLDFEIR